MNQMRIDTDRRRSPRAVLSRPCKIHHVPTGRYWPGVTWDISSGGVLLGVDAPRDLKPGDAIELYISWSSRPLLKSEDCIIAEVKRVLPRTDGRQFVGLEFAEQLTLMPAQAAA